MKKFNLFLILFLVPMMVFGQVTIQSNGVFKSSGNPFFLSCFGGSGINNVSFGNGSMQSSLQSSTNLNTDNTALGFFTLCSNSTGIRNTATGNMVLYNNTTGQYNTATGYNALLSNIGGSYNTANGANALYSNLGSCNTANGYYTLYSNTSGNYNTATGYYALRYNKTGSYNTANGSYALYNNTGSYNTGIGRYALYNNTGDYNTAVGNLAGYSNTSSWTNTTAIGYDAQNSQSNEVRLGNSSVTHIGGQVTWSTWSDGRTKKNIRAEVPGLDFINLLQPVTYNFDMDAIDEILKSDDPEINRLSDSIRLAQSSEEKEILAKARTNMGKQVFSGFIAQDVEKAAQSIGYDFSGVDAPENDKGAYSLRYAEFVVPLVKAVQELSEQNNAKDAAIASLQEQVNELYAKLNELTSTTKPAAGLMDESVKNFTFSIFPNPTSGFVTIDYTLYIDAPISIELYNVYGQRVKLILPQQNQKAGTYSVQTTVGDLIPGAYPIKVTSGNQIESKQLIVN